MLGHGGNYGFIKCTHAPSLEAISRSRDNHLMNSWDVKYPRRAPSAFSAPARGERIAEGRLVPVYVNSLFDQRIGGFVGIRLGKRTSAATLSVLSVLALSLTACTSSTVEVGDATANTISGDTATSIEEAVNNAMKLSGSTSAVVGVWQGEDAAYVQGFGEGVDANTKIRGAQATQPVMCAALLDLVADGTLSLDRKVTSDISRQVGIDDVTYGQLCTDTSGLADFKGEVRDIFANNPTRTWPDRELLAQSLADSPLSWPGLDVHIADTNALLLGRALHQVTEAGLPDLLQKRVFATAGMTSSYYPNDLMNDTTVNDGMVGYTYPMASGKPVCDVEQPTRVAEVSPSMLSGAGATVTTVTDLKNFYAHYLDGSFGADSKALITETVSTINPKRDEDGKPLEEQKEPSKKAKKAERFWGFGLEKIDSLYGMSGSMTGTITAAYHDPESGFSVVVALNNSTAGANFARNLALQLAAISGEEMTVSAEDRAESLSAAAVCQPEEESDEDDE